MTTTTDENSQRIWTRTAKCLQSHLERRRIHVNTCLGKMNSSQAKGEEPQTLGQLCKYILPTQTRNRK